jgi:hypothetical protein
MSKFTHIYQVYHRNQMVGMFAKRKNAVKYAKSFNTEIEGYTYPVNIVKKDLLDHVVEEDDS